MSLVPDIRVLARAGVLLAAGAIAGLVANAARKEPLSLRGFEPQVACSGGPEEGGPVVELHAHDASAMCGREGVFFADARSAERYAVGHVAGAIHLPCDTSASGAEGVLRALGPARTIVVYGDTTEEAREVAETLRQRAPQADVRVLSGGFPAWEQEGLACASGPCRHCTLAGAMESL